jgi:starvation-inducible DNA-binding protein
MNELVAALQNLLGNAYVMYYKAHAYHWNVEGLHFSQYHDFFGELYEDVYNSVDPIAENLRKIDVYAPVSLLVNIQAASIVEDTVKPVLITEMLQNLLTANTTILESLNRVFSYAQLNNLQGLCNFIADRIDTHKKHEWQLKASLKTIGN